MLVGTAAASLIGLLFIAVSMHIDTIVSLQKTDAVRALAEAKRDSTSQSL